MKAVLGLHSPLTGNLPGLPVAETAPNLGEFALHGSTSRLDQTLLDKSVFLGTATALLDRIVDGRLNYQTARMLLAEAISYGALDPADRHDAYRAASLSVSAADPRCLEKRFVAAGLGVADVEIFVENHLVGRAKNIVQSYLDHRAEHEPVSQTKPWNSPFCRILSMHDFWGDSMCALRGRVELALMGVQNSDFKLIHQSCERLPKLQGEVHTTILALSGLTQMFSSAEAVAGFYAVRWNELNPRYDELSRDSALRTFLRSSPYADFKALSDGLLVAADGLAKVGYLGFLPPGEHQSIAA